MEQTLVRRRTTGKVSEQPANPVALHPEEEQRIRELLKNPLIIQRELNNRSLYQFIQYFWPMASAHKFSHNWHIEYLCHELEIVAERVANHLPKEYDLIINVPPGSTKTITCSIMFPVWCWTKWPWMRFITSSYSSTLSLESADYSRDIIKSQMFREMYPELSIKDDKDVKSNFRIVKTLRDRNKTQIVGGNRYSTSVGGTLTGFHGDILIVDDPLNPTQAVSEVGLRNANNWVEQTLSTRKTDKAITPTILIMQRLNQDDPTGHTLEKQKGNVKHISLPGEVRHFAQYVKPPELIKNYVDELLDPKRLPWRVLKDLEADLGQYGYAGQIGQNPTPPGGGMFHVDQFSMIESLPDRHHWIGICRFWDKAATQGAGAFTSGVKMIRLTNGKWIIADVRRGQWSTDQRERIIRITAEADGRDVLIYGEQEPGSSGKDSAQATVRNLAGFVAEFKPSSGDKVFRADPYSVSVNNGDFMLLKGEWNRAFVEEHRFFPYGTYKDQVDSASGAYNKLFQRRFVKSYR